MMPRNPYPDRATRDRQCSRCLMTIAAGDPHMTSAGGCHYHDGCIERPALAEDEKGFHSMHMTGELHRAHLPPRMRWR